MTGVAEEGAGVGQHADEVAEQSQVGQGGHLLDHAGLGVVEPPAGTVLNLTGDLGTLESAQEGAQLSVVAGIQGVQDGLGQLLLLVQLAHNLGQSLAGVGDGDAVEAGVGTQLAEHGVLRRQEKWICMTQPRFAYSRPQCSSRAVL